MASKIITQEDLRQILHYDPETGIFTWLRQLSYRGKLGTRAGCFKTRSGRVVIGMFGTEYYAYRLAWLYMTGVWPPMDIDHIDGDPRNNRFSNLRLCTMSQNIQNQRRAKSNSTTGLLGAWPTPGGRFFSCIKVKGHVTYLGNFKTAQEAHHAYIAAKRKLHEFNTL